jgi:hypothetical protein
MALPNPRLSRDDDPGETIFPLSRTFSPSLAMRIRSSSSAVVSNLLFACDVFNP